MSAWLFWQLLGLVAFLFAAAVDSAQRGPERRAEAAAVMPPPPPAPEPPTARVVRGGR